MSTDASRCKPLHQVSPGSSCQSDQVLDSFANHAHPLLVRLQELINTWPGRLRTRFIDRILNEFHATSTIFAPFTHVRKVAFFGSSRVQPDHEEYGLALSLAGQFVDNGFMVITGAGPGIMAAAQKGSGRANGFGLRIVLPFHNPCNETIANDAKMAEYDYYFTRKISFAWESDAFVVFPGGFGTLDETFEVITMIQTGKTDIVPLVFVERPGGSFWEGCLRFFEQYMVKEGYLSSHELGLFTICKQPEHALEHIKRFYANYHSCRWQDDELAIYVRKELTTEALADLSQRFASLLGVGTLRQSPCFFQADKPIGPNPYCIKLIPRARRYGQIRCLIDAINDASVVV